MASYTVLWVYLFRVFVLNWEFLGGFFFFFSFNGKFKQIEKH